MSYRIKYDLGALEGINKSGKKGVGESKMKEKIKNLKNLTFFLNLSKAGSVYI